MNCFLDKQRVCGSDCMAYVSNNASPCRLLHGVIYVEQIAKILARKERGLVSTPPPRVMP